MIIGVTGFRGRLGSELVKLGCKPLDCDVVSGADIKRAIDVVNPDVIINCAAKTNVDKCETAEGYDEARVVNFRGATNIRDVFPGYLIHISTDYVFDCKEGPYSEDYDELNPINNYGFSKFGAEAGLISPFSFERTMVVRTTGLYGGSSGKADFVSAIVKALTRKEEIKVTDELYGNQTYIPHLAEALIQLTKIRNPVKLLDKVHIGSTDVITRYEFALMIADKFELDKDLIIPCSNKEVPGWIAKRPTYGGLLTKKAAHMNLSLYTIQEGLNELKNTGWRYYENK